MLVTSVWRISSLKCFSVISESKWASFEESWHVWLTGLLSSWADFCQYLKIKNLVYGVWNWKRKPNVGSIHYCTEFLLTSLILTFQKFLIHINLTSAFVTPASSLSFLFWFRNKKLALPKAGFQKRRLCLTEEWLAEHSCSQSVFAAFLSWRCRPSGLLQRGTMQLPWALCRHRCFLPVKSSWKHTCKLQESPPPSLQAGGRTVILFHSFSLLFLKGKMGRKPTKSLNLCSYSSYPKRDIVCREMDWAEEHSFWEEKPFKDTQ